MLLEPERWQPAPTSRDRLFSGLCSWLGHDSARMLFKFYDVARFDLFGAPLHAYGSVDITYRCNLKCRHCYFLEQDFHNELSDEQWIRLFEELGRQGFPFYQCSWAGGEPLLRKDLVGRLMRLFKSNVVATNGTLPLPDWPDVNFYVSIDGTPEHCREMRGRDLYPVIKANTRRPDLRFTGAMVITRRNWNCLDRLLDEWSQSDLQAMLFQFYTPIRGQTDDLWPPWELRDRVLRRLIELRQRYGQFIVQTEDLLEQMMSHRAAESTDPCLYSATAFTLDPTGRPKHPCVMGPKADCSRCGCILPYHYKLMEGRSLFLYTLGALLRSGRSATVSTDTLA